MPVKHREFLTGDDLLIDILAENKRLLVQIDRLSDPFLSNDKCLHRDGPLHLCYKDAYGVNVHLKVSHHGHTKLRHLNNLSFIEM